MKLNFSVMKKLLLLLTCSFGLTVLAQKNINILHSTYSTMKQNGSLDVTKNYIFTDAIAPIGAPVSYKETNSNHTPSSICSCMIPLDTSFHYVPFVSYWSDATTAVYGANYMNDDASSIPINLPFTFNFYGANHSTVFINANGNVSFNTYYSQFTANPFPDASYNMIAPFWADVDTRDFATTASNIYYKITPTAMIVKWENVGYYNQHFDKHNTFQLIITNGSDPILPAGKNVGFCYGNMEWTTGDVTGGGGFGSPATVGVNQGNGVDYFQLGTFYQPTINFDGPYNAPDGVFWLNNQGMYFDVASLGNIPPVIINNNICDTIDVYTGDTTHAMIHFDSVTFDIGMSTPEINQTVSATLSSTEPSAFSYVETMNTTTYKKYACTFVAKNLPLGLYYVTVTATDNGTPSKSTSQIIVIRSSWDPGIATAIVDANETLSISIFPNPAENSITVKQNFEISSEPMLTIRNVIGQSLLSTPLNSHEQTFDISMLSKGIYEATITNKKGKTKTIKIVRE